MNHVPVAIGLILCEQIIIDETSRNVTPVSCFSARTLKSIPGKIDFDVVAWLGDGIGEMPVRLLVQKADTLEELLRVDGKVIFKDPLKYKRFFAHVRNCPIPSAGQYVVSLLVTGEPVASRKFGVNPKEA